MNEYVCLADGEIWSCQHESKCECCHCKTGYKLGQIELTAFRKLTIEYGLVKVVKE